MGDIFRNIGETFRGRTICWVDICELTPRVNQPLNKELMNDILEKGLEQPLILKSNKHGNVWRGNQRYIIFKKLGINKVPVVFYHKKKMYK